MSAKEILKAVAIVVLIAAFSYGIANMKYFYREGLGYPMKVPVKTN